MDGVTDSAWRRITKKYGQPDLTWTEFVNVEGLARAEEKLRGHLECKASEGRVIGQLYGLEPENFRRATKLMAEMAGGVGKGGDSAAGLVGVDINMGCPARAVALNGAGAGLIKDKGRAKAIYEAVREEADKVGLAVSVKTRLGWEKVELEKWIGWILEEWKPDALTVHGRTYKQGFSGTADWESLAEVGRLRGGGGQTGRFGQKIGEGTVIFGNGDVRDYEDGIRRGREAGLDGVLIGRGAIGKPWVFLPERERADLLERVKVGEIMIEHSRLFMEEVRGRRLGAENELEGGIEGKAKNGAEGRVGDGGDKRGREEKLFWPMRKHLAAYASGFSGAAKVRVALCQTSSVEEVERVVNELPKGVRSSRE